MKKILLLPILAFSLMGCENHDRTIPNDTRQVQEDSDNTGRNVRDRDANAVLPFDQSESDADLTITQKIRKAILNDNSLSLNAKNIKIITVDGVVTLRGPVATAQEKDAIAKKVNDIRGIKRVDNQLEITRNY